MRSDGKARTSYEKVATLVMAERLPVTLITGFLGSGKTTLMRHLLSDPAMADAVVVVNEFGEIGLDHLLIAGSADDVVLLESGCLCCATTAGLGEALASLYSRRAAGTLSRFGRVVVETSGLADPAPLAQVFLRDSFIKRHYFLDGIVVTVDSMFGQSQIKQTTEVPKQISFADRIILTKIDLPDVETNTGLIAEIRALNPHAPMLECAHGVVDADLLRGMRTLEVRRDKPLELSRGHTHEHSHGSHTTGVSTHTVTVPALVTWENYARWRAFISTVEECKLLRIKGILMMEPDGAPYVVQAVHHVFSAPDRLQDDGQGRSGGWLTFFIKDAEPQAIVGSVNLLQSIGGE